MGLLREEREYESHVPKIVLNQFSRFRLWGRRRTGNAQKSCSKDRSVGRDLVSMRLRMRDVTEQQKFWRLDVDLPPQKGFLQILTGGV
jgi:hypothetical protein